MSYAFCAAERVNAFYEKEVRVMAKDPVCGMEVKENEAAAVSEYKGKKYIFCSPGCKEKFTNDPEKYLGKEKK